MASEEIWRQRVVAWRASGKSADGFCAGEEFSASLLRHWAWRLGLTKRRGRKKDAERTKAVVRLARVRVKHAPPVATGARGSIHIEARGLRIEVKSDVDEATLAMVLRVVEHRPRKDEEVRS